ncbi:MAG: tRNA (guanosine(46)-N7)-methyltransferase TrmB [Myxococcota bacterium]
MRARKPAVLEPGQPEPLLEEPRKLPAWKAEFGRAAPIEVDVGFGKGDYLLAVSEERPEIDYVGIDYNRQRVLKLRDHLVRRARKNVRLACGDTTILLPRLFAPGTVQAFTINFPDPWPKRRHHRRRFVTRAFGDLLASRLIAGGTLTVATDFRPYAEQIIETLHDVAGLVAEFGAPGYATSLPNRIETIYERKYREMGRTNHYMRYLRV